MQSAGQDVTLLNLTLKPRFDVPIRDPNNSCIHKLKKRGVLFLVLRVKEESSIIRIELLYSQNTSF